ncbi:unnamed protein product [Brachionus calyciflorus]|uniref:Uncharacterized protein n=1 Tax=Brachionus calyciflorus TaxID=104777 RepID=A0A813YUQ1_9BILA|nr:unnamed protein product [Brachionus calyciflorus]
MGLNFYLIIKNYQTDCMAAYEIDLDKIFKTNRNVSSHPTCPEEWITIDETGKIIFKDKFKIVNCSYSNVLRIDDFEYTLTEFKSITNGSYLDTNKEFFHISCNSKTDKFYTGFAKVFSKNETTQQSDKINVLVFLMDSLSREDWFYNLPKSMEYLVKTLGANIFHRYNTVGDGTTESLTPLLTSKKVNELPNVYRGQAKASFVDEVFPFIWNDFKKELGYKTMYAEDMAFIGTFNMRFKGMKNQPADHYPR